MDRGCLIDVLESPIQEVVMRLREAWQERAKVQIARRDSFEGVVHCSRMLTTERMQHMDPHDAAILRTCLNGTYFTADRLKCQLPDSTGMCRFCNQTDSQKHRHWRCPAFSACRAISDEQIAMLEQIAPCLEIHGWVPEPPSLRAFRVACASVSHATTFEFPMLLPDNFHMFTDGGCLSLPVIHAS